MSWRSAQTWNLEACGVYFGAKDDVIQDIADEGCYSFGWRLLQTWQSQPAIRREFCGAERLAQLV